MSQTQSAAEVSSQPNTIAARGEPIHFCGSVLLVEDETFVREIAGEILECEGYRVLMAHDAAEARKLFRRYKKIIRLLLTDVVLPGQNGWDLAKDLRAQSPGIIVIFTSGYPKNRVTQSAVVEDRMYYLPKPFSAESLTRKVREVLVTRKEEIAI